MYRGRTLEPLFFTRGSSRGTYGFGNGSGDQMGEGGLLTGSVVFGSEVLPLELENKYKGNTGEKQEGGCGKSLRYTGSIA